MRGRKRETDRERPKERERILGAEEWCKMNEQGSLRDPMINTPTIVSLECFYHLLIRIRKVKTKIIIIF